MDRKKKQIRQAFVVMRNRPVIGRKNNLRRLLVYETGGDSRKKRKLCGIFYSILRNCDMFLTHRNIFIYIFRFG